MQSLFKKFFKSGAEHDSMEAAAATPAKHSAPAPVAAAGPREERKMEQPKQRKVVQAPLIGGNGDKSVAAAGGILIKARPDRMNPENCIFMLDRPVFRGHSAWFPTPESTADAPLAAALFEVPGVDNVLFLDTTITVGRDPSIYDDWKPKAKELGAKIREHIQSGKPLLEQAFIDSIPPDDEIRARIQAVIDDELNPGIAAHSGVISLIDVTGNTVRINMGGGCQGCAASTITLKQGIHAAFREAVPEVGAIIDDTDHAAGENPYFKELPAGMF